MFTANFNILGLTVDITYTQEHKLLLTIEPEEEND